MIRHCKCVGMYVSVIRRHRPVLHHKWTCACHHPSCTCRHSLIISWDSLSSSCEQDHAKSIEFLHNSSYPAKSCQDWHSMGWDHWMSILAGSCQDLTGNGKLCKTSIDFDFYSLGENCALAAKRSVDCHATILFTISLNSAKLWNSQFNWPVFGVGMHKKSPNDSVPQHNIWNTFWWWSFKWAHHMKVYFKTCSLKSNANVTSLGNWLTSPSELIVSVMVLSRRSSPYLKSPFVPPFKVFIFNTNLAFLYKIDIEGFKKLLAKI